MSGGLLCTLCSVTVEFFLLFNQINKQPMHFSLTMISPSRELGLIPQGPGAEPSSWRCQATVTEDAEASELSRCRDRWRPTCALARGTRGPAQCHMCCGKALNTLCNVISWLLQWELVSFLLWRLIMCCLDVLDIPAPVKTSVTMNTWNVFAFPSSGLKFYHFLFPHQHLIILKQLLPCLLGSRPRVSFKWTSFQTAKWKENWIVSFISNRKEKWN